MMSDRTDRTRALLDVMGELAELRMENARLRRTSVRIYDLCGDCGGRGDTMEELSGGVVAVAACLCDGGLILRDDVGSEDRAYEGEPLRLSFPASWAEGEHQ